MMIKTGDNGGQKMLTLCIKQPFDSKSKRCWRHQPVDILHCQHPGILTTWHGLQLHNHHPGRVRGRSMPGPGRVRGRGEGTSGRGVGMTWARRDPKTAGTRHLGRISGRWIRWRGVGEGAGDVGEDDTLIVKDQEQQ